MLYNKKHVYLRAPLRISFVGGGTDIESYYAQGRTGHVVSATIDSYVYVSIKDMFDSNVRVHHAEIETESIASRIKHAYARTALEHFGMFKGAEVVLTSDVMTTGSGLGASSSMMSALVLGCSSLRGTAPRSKHELAELTFALEHEAGTTGGKQDQYAAVFGGLNSISFSTKGVTVRPVRISAARLKEFESRLFLVFTNLARDSKSIQQRLSDNSRNEKTVAHFDALHALSHEFMKILSTPRADINELGALLHEGWKHKKSTNPLSSNPYIDQLYETLRTRGILGGKVLGAGGGGFILAFAREPEIKKRIAYELYPNFLAHDVKFSTAGTEIVWKNF